MNQYHVKVGNEIIAVCESYRAAAKVVDRWHGEALKAGYPAGATISIVPEMSPVYLDRSDPDYGDRYRAARGI